MGDLTYKNFNKLKFFNFQSFILVTYNFIVKSLHNLYKLYKLNQKVKYSLFSVTFSLLFLKMHLNVQFLEVLLKSLF